ncbi:MAG: ComF family protein [Rhodocyclaceae bacterium]|nr:ComF family protein [Rhodocyclaceae bacterium]
MREGRDAVLRAECFLCGREHGGGAVCEACSADLPWWDSSHACPRCALPVASAGECGACLRVPPPIERCHALFDYAFPVPQLVQGLKYGQALELAPWLGLRLCDRLPVEASWDAVIPVPLHPARLRERGFNQAVELARPLARTRAAPLAGDELLRVRATPAQAGLSARVRRGNLRGAFQAAGRLPWRHVLVVDDVMTTGATLMALADALKAAGVARVDAVVVARTPAP